MFKEILTISQIEYLAERRKGGKRGERLPWISKEVKDNIKTVTKANRIAKARGTLKDWEFTVPQQCDWLTSPLSGLRYIEDNFSSPPSQGAIRDGPINALTPH